MATAMDGEARGVKGPLLIRTEPQPTSAVDLYLDLLKKTLTRAIAAKRTERHSLRARFPPKRLAISLLRSMLRPAHLELVRLVHCTEEDYLESSYLSRKRAEDAETMLGVRQFDNMQACLTDVIRSGVPGDVLEAGVWRGGMTIFMRGLLKAYGITDRKVWVVDSFAGLPEPDRDVESFGWREGDMAASLEEVQGYFERYGLLDEQVGFLKGYFDKTLPGAPIPNLAILRLDADLYESTRVALEHLYPKLSRGGYAIFDDYQNLPDCRRAIDEYRARNGITDRIAAIDRRAVYWQKWSSQSVVERPGSPKSPPA